MKKNLLTGITLFLTLLLLTSCEAIAGIFKAGMGVGIFIVVAIIVLIFALVFRAGKSK
jgi:hypothetical protein